MMGRDGFAVAESCFDKIMGGERLRVAKIIPTSGQGSLAPCLGRGTDSVFLFP